MPEYELRDNLDRLSEVIYFTDSFLALHIDNKINIFLCIYIVVWKKHGLKAQKKQLLVVTADFEVVPPGIEPGTQGFSVLCSTN